MYHTFCGNATHDFRAKGEICGRKTDASRRVPLSRNQDFDLFRQRNKQTSSIGLKALKLVVFLAGNKFRLRIPFGEPLTAQDGAAGKARFAEQSDEKSFPKPFRDMQSNFIYSLNKCIRQKSNTNHNTAGLIPPRNAPRRHNPDCGISGHNPAHSPPRRHRESQSRQNPRKYPPVCGRAYPGA